MDKNEFVTKILDAAITNKYEPSALLSITVQASNIYNTIFCTDIIDNAKVPDTHRIDWVYYKNKMPNREDCYITTGGTHWILASSVCPNTKPVLVTLSYFITTRDYDYWAPMSIYTNLIEPVRDI